MSSVVFKPTNHATDRRMIDANFKRRVESLVRLKPQSGKATANASVILANYAKQMMQTRDKRCRHSSISNKFVDEYNYS